jgi:predicted MPP superfamily phosphohydrolase
VSGVIAAGYERAEVAMRRLCGFGFVCWLCQGVAAAQGYAPASAAESNALAEVRAQRTAGVIALQPWAQVLGGGRLGVGWLTDGPADGVAEWTQDEGEPAEWRTAWYAEDGLRQANGTAQRAVVAGYDPSKPIRIRAVSRPITSFKPYKVTFGAAATSEVRRLPPAARADGVSFVVFNDIHSRPQLYPLLMAKAGARPDFAVFNGDVLQDPQSEREVDENLLQPMAWLTAQGVPCFFLRGNHETRGAFARQLKPLLVLPDNRYYSALTFGPARVLFLESGEDKPDTSKEYSGLVDFDAYIEDELAWLRREVDGEAFRRAVWRIAVVHIPPDWRKDEAALWHGERRMRERFAPLFDAGRVDVVISGHTHKAEVVGPCPDARRGFRWPVFIGGAHPLTNATVVRVEADVQTLKVACFRSDGTVAFEKAWSK